jgi:hypothetical protein
MMVAKSGQPSMDGTDRGDERLFAIELLRP